MSYADKADIEGELKGVSFETDTTVTSTNINSMLAQESAVIDQYLSAQYVTPVTDASALLVLKKICIDFTVYRIVKILKTKSKAPLPDTNMYQEVNEGSAYRESKKLLTMYQSGQMSLNGASRIGSKANIISISPKKNTSERVFKKDEQQW